ncbi:MAG: DUF448 domain-containing protein [Sandaracinaceae bacterium]|jgi:predicted RNA-binding protein YlxR (DUF448 family)/ribosomal protein L7Ae-like RNA K-turn-binding protein|nr:DUF448 domain-containing protein [Sandaracinaceae bacterium]MBP7683075.1 DUF448 domain-containing protein [Deltaproteobacteria bacterium]MBK7155073.1 DUF448 domain-containing protein [Sandaracinaceae bacterium]MBK7774119.1 DUF448 domain-containing protein [Sandaracinaceae bacterium]MBK8409814.1 DUF448 domain-containing protein [Sandaracinaceae bacterium]
MNAQEANEEPETHPERMCVGCRQKAERQDLVRFALGPTPPYVAPDPGRRLGGKGASVHPTRACLERAIARGGFARAAKQPVHLNLDAIVAALVAFEQRRASSLLMAAYRSRKLVLGTDAVREAMRAGGIPLLVVAHDAAGRRFEIEKAAERLGTACVVFGDKAALGALLRKDEVGVLALLDAGVAAEFAQAAARIRALREDEG